MDQLPLLTQVQPGQLSPHAQVRPTPEIEEPTVLPPQGPPHPAPVALHFAAAPLEPHHKLPHTPTIETPKHLELHITQLFLAHLG